jgi:ribosome recycling factor|tara:strand:+ start:350 stop:937 length:588 start_codon:yes stop_codon:yes gene_type:complete
MPSNEIEPASNSEDIVKESQRRMSQAVEFLKRGLSTIRTGRATPSIVENILIDYYGTPTPLKQLASLSAPDAQLILVQPYDRSSIKEIEKAILSSSMGFNPANDGNIIRIPIPPLSQDRRKELAKSVGKMIEESKIAVRNVRRDGIEKLKNLQRNKSISEDEGKRAEVDLQKQTASHTSIMDDLYSQKSVDLMTV